MAAAALGLSRAEEHNFAFVCGSLLLLGPKLQCSRQRSGSKASNVRARRVALRALKVTGHHSREVGMPVKGLPVALDIGRRYAHD